MKKKKLLKAIKDPENFDIVISTILDLLKNSLTKKGCRFTCQSDVSNYLKLNFRNSINELFSCLFLDNGYKLIAYEELFSGTINKSQVYARVVVQRALFHNAAAVIFAHNHPSLDLTPSESDKHLTRKLIDILEVVDVRVLDHFIVSPIDTYSMAKNGNM